MMQQLYVKVKQQVVLHNSWIDISVSSTDPNVVNALASSCVDGAVRLMKKDQVDQLEGRVEICVNNIWGTVCDRGFNKDEADVICRQLDKNGGFEGLCRSNDLCVCCYLTTGISD